MHERIVEVHRGAKNFFFWQSLF